jgi:hypothetical protein
MFTSSLCSIYRCTNRWRHLVSAILHYQQVLRDYVFSGQRLWFDAIVLADGVAKQPRIATKAPVLG